MLLNFESFTSKAKVKMYVFNKKGKRHLIEEFSLNRTSLHKEMPACPVSNNFRKMAIRVNLNTRAS